MKTYFSHSMYPGGDKVKTLAEIRAKTRIYNFEAVKGMLPRMN